VQFDPNGTAATVLQAEIDTALRAYLVTASMKDLTTNELADGPDYITTVWSLVQTLYAQRNIRFMAPAYVAAIDAGAITTRDVWTSDHWQAFLLKMSTVKVPLGILSLTQILNPIFAVYKGNQSRRYRESMISVFCPHMTAAEAWSALGTLQTLTEAFNYFSKCNIALETFTLPTPTILDIHPWVASADLMAFQDLIYWPLRNAANTGIIMLTSIGPQAGFAKGSVLDADIATGFMTSATWYTGGYLHKPTSVKDWSNLYALLQILAPYDAAHNTYGCCSLFDDSSLGTTQAASTLYAAMVAHDGTTCTICGEADFIYVSPVSVALFQNNTTQTCIKTLEAGHTLNVTVHNCGSVDYLTPESAWWNDVVRNFFALTLQGSMAIKPTKSGAVIA